MTADDFARLFTPEGLTPFVPSPGSEGFTPTLEVHTAGAVLLFVLALDGYNDWATRQGYLRGLGMHVAADHEVVAVRFGSEAWVRSFTPAEAAARGTRLVETYDDKEEAIIVMGQMADGPGYMARALVYRKRPLFRKRLGAVSHLGPWELFPGTQQHSPLLEAFWEGYHASRVPLG